MGFPRPSFCASIAAPLREGSMTDTSQANAALAEAAGLQRAWADHRADVEEAILAAARLRQAFARPGNPASEPMPAHRAPEHRG